MGRPSHRGNSREHRVAVTPVGECVNDGQIEIAARFETVMVAEVLNDYIVHGSTVTRNAGLWMRLREPSHDDDAAINVVDDSNRCGPSKPRPRRTTPISVVKVPSSAIARVA